MNRMTLLSLLVLLSQITVVDAAVEPAAVPNPAGKPAYLQVSVDRVTIDTQGLIQASENLSVAIEKLAASIEQLSTNSAALSEQDKELMMSAVKSVDTAGQAFRELARGIPRAAQDFGERLPQAIRDSGQPIADLSSGLRSASDSVQLITDSLPEATENAKSLVNATLDAAVARLSMYTFVLFAALALALIAVVWFIYRQYLDPLARKLDQLTGAPEHLEAMARQMQQTSANLLQLERETRGGNRSPATD